MKIVIIDDHPLIRRGMWSIISDESEMDIVGEASNVKEGIEVISKVKPDLVLQDIRLGSENGLDVIRRINAMEITTRFILLTSYMDDKIFSEAENMGVRGYILKGALPEEILYALRVVNKGRKYYDPEISQHLINETHKNPSEILTARERDVISCLAKGMSNKEIACEHFITEYTVKKHVSQILSKLQLSDRTQAAIYAYDSGMIKR